MRAVLVPPPYRGSEGKTDYFPLGLLALHQILSQAGHDCRISVPAAGSGLPPGSTVTLDRWAADILATAPDCVGLSTNCDSYPHDILLARTIKELAPQTCIVLGGPQASVVAQESLAAFPWIDYIVRGEAERAILPFARVVEGKETPDRVPGLTYRAEGKIHSTPPAPLLEDLDSLGLPDYRAYPRFEQAALRTGTQPGETLLPLEAGRGCPYGCVFCSTSLYWSRRRRQKSPGLLARQMGSLVDQYRVDAVALMQDLFAVEGTWLDEFLRAMETTGPVKWACSLRPDSVTVDTLLAMRRAGCDYVFFGVETGSQRMQKRIGKNLDMPATIRAVEAAARCGMRVTASFVAGFPWETRQDLQETLSLHKHFINVGVELSQVVMLSPSPKTPITLEHADKLRLDNLHSYPMFGEGAEGVEIEQLIRRYPHIFTSFYHLESEFVPREELLIAVWAANALQSVSTEERAQAGAEKDAPFERPSAGTAAKNAR